MGVLYPIDFVLLKGVRFLVLAEQVVSFNIVRLAIFFSFSRIVQGKSCAYYNQALGCLPKLSLSNRDFPS